MRLVRRCLSVLLQPVARGHPRLHGCGRQANAPQYYQVNLDASISTALRNKVPCPLIPFWRLPHHAVPPQRRNAVRLGHFMTAENTTRRS